MHRYNYTHTSHTPGLKLIHLYIVFSFSLVEISHINPHKHNEVQFIICHVLILDICLMQTQETR